ncbi:hypothetical protein Z042_18165 [Chania multitudinisentens RB-25]|uniref:Lipoprotein n=1 Tax=Chania multitudinisentens RB-25 TaxID=1441930 RepID=W0LC37_9GAMM|nr:hypothetical protein [Chania multitudinisentens]AHG21311.1 hypothetical protein Z042_18165 [Chania multitudinisentens RB-25]
MKAGIIRKAILALGLAITLVGCNSQQPLSQSGASAERLTATEPAVKLGTKWGENVSSSVVSVDATRLRSSPERVVAIYYNGGESEGSLKTTIIPMAAVEVSVQDGRRRNMALRKRSSDEYTLAAKEGERYQLHFYNRSSSTSYEIVATVDGLDVISGRAGSLSQSGYLIRPKSSLTIEGFRKSDSAVAAFRFAKPEASYAAHSTSGDIDNTGVIGIALFEMAPERLPDCQPQAFPKDHGYAPEPCEKRN